MRIIIAGTRSFNDYELLSEKVSEFVNKITSHPTVVSGGARGADRLGEWWAFENEFHLVRFEADWNEFGKSAGMIRNKQMAEYAEALIVFWDGISPGTRNMINLGIEYGLIMKVIKYNE